MSSLEQRLQDRVQELEALLGVGNDDVSRLMTVLDATPQQCEMVGFMLKRAVATRTALFIALFGARPECDQPDMKLIDVQMVRVRGALKAIGIEVQTAWGSGGWSIANADKARLRALMADGGASAIDEAREALHARRMAFLEGSGSPKSQGRDAAVAAWGTGYDELVGAPYAGDPIRSKRF